MNILSYFRGKRKEKQPKNSLETEWYVEYEGVKIGELTNPRCGFDMFWIDYDFILYPGFEKIALDKENWLQCRLEYISKHSGRLSEYGICGGDAVVKKDEKYMVSMRGL